MTDNLPNQDTTQSLLDTSFFEAAFATQAIRGGFNASDEAEHSPAIFMTSSFTYASAADAAAHFSGESKGNIYSRFTNPTVQAFERRLAMLEGGERCVATASGMGAILAMCLAFLKAGDHVVSSRSLFGSTMSLFNRYIAKFDVEISYVDADDMNAWQEAMRPNTKLLYCETPSNPLAQICNLTALAKLAHTHDALFAVDNCLCTPALQQPLQYGADIVIHSATKYLDGQGRAIGGALVGSHELMEKPFGVVRTGGVSMSPFSAWIFLKGLETLPLRMNAHCDSAFKIAKWLDAHPKVNKVYYAGLPSHPNHTLAAQQQAKFGAIVGFEVDSHGASNEKPDAKQAAWQVIDSTKMISITGNLGDVRSTITHPATTTHRRLSDEDKQKAGIKNSLVRLSVGLEDTQDLINDLARGLDAL